MPPSKKTMQDVLNSCIQKQTDVVVFYLSITYFQFQFLLAFIACPMTKYELLTSSALTQNFCRRRTSQHAVNADKLCTTAVTAWYGMVY